MFNRFRVQKKYIAFLIIMPLLAVTSLLQVECPVCQGTGCIASMPAMENIEIVSAESEELFATPGVCAGYIAYRYNISLILKNNGSEDAEGSVKLVLKDIREGGELDIKYLSVAIPGESAIETTYPVWFRTREPKRTNVLAEVVTVEIPDETCGGTGKVSTNTWLLINGFEDKFREEVRINKYESDWHPTVTPGEGWAE